MNCFGHKYGRDPELPVLIVCTVQHALNCRVAHHPDSKRQAKTRLRDLSNARARWLKRHRGDERRFRAIYNTTVWNPPPPRLDY